MSFGEQIVPRIMTTLRTVFAEAVLVKSIDIAASGGVFSSLPKAIVFRRDRLFTVVEVGTGVWTRSEGTVSFAFSSHRLDWFISEETSFGIIVLRRVRIVRVVVADCGVLLTVPLTMLLRRFEDFSAVAEEDASGTIVLRRFLTELCCGVSSIAFGLRLATAVGSSCTFVICGVNITVLRRDRGVIDFDADPANNARRVGASSVFCGVSCSVEVVMAVVGVVLSV